MTMPLSFTDEVLGFWFGGVSASELDRVQPSWFAKDDAFDASIRARFLPLVEAIEAGTLPCDLDDAKSTLAWTIAADQFPRNLFRGSPRAFACDPAARASARAALSNGLDQSLPPVARWFLYLPLEHSEDLADQDECVRLFTSLPVESAGRASVIDYAERHRDIIRRFGRFPHRNAALGRVSTEAELRFLQEPGSSF